MDSPGQVRHQGCHAATAAHIVWHDYLPSKQRNPHRSGIQQLVGLSQNVVYYGIPQTNPQENFFEGKLMIIHD